MSGNYGGAGLVAAAAAAEATASAATASATVFPRFGFIDSECPAIEIFSIQTFNRSLSSFFGIQFDKPESARTACLTISDQARGADLAILTKLILQILLRCAERQVSDIKFD